MAAAIRVLDIWSGSDSGAWRNSDNSPLPDAFQEPLRRLMVADMNIEDFRRLASVLAIHDAEWFADPSHVSASPHAGSLEARFYISRAGNLKAMIEIMGEVIRGGSAPLWVLDERDSLRFAAVEILLDNVDDPDTSFGGIALDMVEQQVVPDPDDIVLLNALGLRVSPTTSLSEVKSWPTGWSHSCPGSLRTPAARRRGPHPA